MNDIMKIIRSFGFAWKGVRHAYRADKSFRMELNYGLPIYVALFFWLRPTGWELGLFVLSYLLILITELQNTAFERMLERVHPEEHELIGRSKDISAAAVAVAFLFAAFVVFLVAWDRYAIGSFSLSAFFV
jgi:diacylglycerol kinase